MYNLQPLDYSNISGSTSINPNGSSNQNQQLNDTNAKTASFNISLMAGFLAFFTAIIAVGILSGLNISIFGSTVQLSQRAQNLLYNSLFYGGLWGIFSVLATIGINGLGLFSIPAFGAFFYLILTLIYILGINQQIQRSPQ